MAGRKSCHCRRVNTIDIRGWSKFKSGGPDAVRSIHYKQGIYLEYVYNILILGRYISLFYVVSNVAAFWLAGFRGANRSNAPINPVDIGTGADPHDEAEFELPDGEAMIEQFLAASGWLGEGSWQRV